jgi:formylglycine-generating enzyme required for sulfatase activity
VRFCEWLSKKENLPYRLPTEAEWEYACRAGSPGRWSWGDDPSRVREFAWTAIDATAPKPVAGKRPNAFGLFDMHGNVSEWCRDYYGAYRDGMAVDPPGPRTGHERVLRGGSCDSGAVLQTRSAARFDSRPDFAYFAYGFRVCLDVPALRLRQTNPR